MGKLLGAHSWRKLTLPPSAAIYWTSSTRAESLGGLPQSMQGCQLVWFCTDNQHADFMYNSPVMSRRHCLTEVLPVLWLLQSFCPLSLDVTWAFGVRAIWGWTL